MNSYLPHATGVHCNVSQTDAEAEAGGCHHDDNLIVEANSDKLSSAGDHLPPGSVRQTFLLGINLQNADHHDILHCHPGWHNLRLVLDNFALKASMF